MDKKMDTRPDFTAIDNAQLSNDVTAIQSDLCWREFLVTNNIFVNYCAKRVKEDEIGDIIKSLQNWTVRREHKNYKIKNPLTNTFEEQRIQLGDIIYVDLGINYSNEASYAHPALVIEHVRESLLIIPTSTNKDKINDAESNEFSQYVKVDKSNGFEDTCVLELDKIKVINSARIIKVHRSLNEDITNPNSLFLKIKNILYKMYFRNHFDKYQELLKENQELRDKIILLQKA